MVGTIELKTERRGRIIEEDGPITGTPAVPDMRLELVPVPVSDIDRAKAFYEKVGFGNLHDTQVTPIMRVVQLTPPGSSCAIVFGAGMGPITDMVPGSVKGLHLVVEDMAATRAALTERGIELSDVEDMGGVLYSFFSDPDGNMGALQQWPAGYQA
jgi:catechol 2,3-dioxygenase-like lactoylglutathione lyase family enzyme